MAKSRRNSIENMFANKGSIQPQKKESITIETIPNEAQEKTIDTIDEVKTVTVAQPEENKDEDNEPIISGSESETLDNIDKVEIREKENIPTNIENLFNKKKKERGKQQSVYLKKEVYDFCNDIAERYEIGISDVINKLILSIMDDV